MLPLAVSDSTASLTKICAWCKRVQVNGVYKEDCRKTYRFPITHGICPDCEVKFRAESGIAPRHMNAVA
jgi:hypothetical protein